MFAGHLGRSGPYLGGTGPGGVGGAGAIGGELFPGDGFGGAWHAIDLPFEAIAWGRGLAPVSAESSDRSGRIFASQEVVTEKGFISFEGDGSREREADG